MPPRQDRTLPARPRWIEHGQPPTPAARRAQTTSCRPVRYPRPRRCPPRTPDFEKVVDMSSRLMPLLASTLLVLAACAGTPTQAPPALPMQAPATATAVPAPPAWLEDLAALYDAHLRVDGLETRTFPPEHWWQAATSLLDRGSGFSVEEIGRSAEGRPLRHVQWGEGELRVLMWSQMHGDESTATM